MVPSEPRPTEKQFTLRGASSCTRRCSVRLAPIAENSSLLPPVGVWAVLNPSVADHPLRPATDRRLGGPLPHQPANRTRTPPQAPSPKRELCLPKGKPMRSCRRFLAGIPHLRAGIHALLTRPPLPPSRKMEDVRLACVRHAASVYPEPGSNSPSMVLFHSPSMGGGKVHVLVSDPVQATVGATPCEVGTGSTWLFAFTLCC